jgi:hypothetical protein
VRAREAFILLGILLVAIAAGLITNPGSFGEDLTASICDLVLGIFITLFILDRITQRERHEKWQRVRKLSYRSIESQCDSILFAFIDCPSVTFDLHTTDESRLPRPLDDVFRSLAEELAAIAHNLADPNEELSPIAWPKSIDGASVSEQMHVASSQYLLDFVTPKFENLSLNVLPRIIELGEDDELIAAFIEVESAYRDWSGNVEVIEGGWGMPDEYAWNAAAKFCNSISSMLRIVIAPSDSDDKIEALPPAKAEFGNTRNVLGRVGATRAFRQRLRRWAQLWQIKIAVSESRVSLSFGKRQDLVGEDPTQDWRVAPPVRRER